MTQGAPAPSVAQRMIAADGSEVFLTPDDAARAYRAGLADFAAGDTAYVRDDVGELHQVDTATAAARLGGSYTAGLGSEYEAAAQQEARDFATLGRRAEALGIGAGNALTLGFGKGLAVDLAAAEDKEATRRYLEAQERQNPGFMMAGEVAGLALPALLSGGTAAAARGAVGGVEAASTLGRGAELLGTAGRAITAPTRALGAIAEGVGGVGTAALGEGVLGRAASAAIRGGVEMVPYSVGEAYSRARIEDKDLTAEHLLAAAGHGALMGGAFGGGLSLAGSGLGAALRGTGKIAEAAAPKVRALAEKLGVDSVPLSLDALVVDQAIKATGANLSQVQKLRAMGAEAEQRVARLITEEVPKLAEKDLARVSREELAAHGEALRKRAGKEIDAAISGLDSAIEKGAERPNLAAVVTAAREQIAPVIAATEELGGKAGVLKKTLSGLDQIVERGEEMTFSRMHDLRQKIDSKIKWGPAEVSLSKEQRAVNDALKDLRSSFEAEIQRAGDAAAAKEGAEFATRWAESKGEYQAAKWLRDAAERGAAGEQRNATMGLREMLGGGAGAQVGSTVGAALGPVGAAVGGVVGGALGAVANNTARRFGNQAVASLAAKAIETDVVRAVTQTIEGTNAAKITDFLKRKTPNLAPVVAEVERVEGRQKRSAQREYEERHRALVAFRTAPEAVLARTLSNAPEEVRQQLAAKTTQVAEYLASKAPAPIGGNPLMPQADPGRVDPAARDRWLRRARAADDPQSVLDDMRKGKLTRDAAETVRDLYPRLYGQITGQIMGELATRKEPLSFAQSQQLHVLLGVPVDVSQAPAYVAAVQHSNPPPVPRTARIEAKADASTSMTGSQKLTQEKPE